MKEDIQKEVLFTPEEAAEYLKISLATIYRYLNQEENPLPSYKISRGVIRIKKDELMSWIENYFQKFEK